MIHTTLVSQEDNLVFPQDVGLVWGPAWGGVIIGAHNGTGWMLKLELRDYLSKVSDRLSMLNRKMKG